MHSFLWGSVCLIYSVDAYGMLHYATFQIWVFTVSKSTHFGVTSVHGLTEKHKYIFQQTSVVAVIKFKMYKAYRVGSHVVFCLDTLHGCSPIPCTDILNDCK